MLHRNHNANLACGSCCSRYRKRVPDRRWWAGLGDGFLFTEEYHGGMARHHLRRIGSMPSNARSGEVEAVFGQRGDCEEENYYCRRTNADTDRATTASTTRHRQRSVTLQLDVHVVQPGSFLRTPIF